MLGWTVGIAALVLGVFHLAVARLRPGAPPATWTPPADLVEYTAILHVHSAYSHDGRGTVEEVAEAAGRAGVRVVFLTDHNTLAPLIDGQERWYGNTLVLVGAEITTGSGYLLLLDPRPDLPVRARGFDLEDLVDRYRAAGAIVLLAHADHPRLGWRGPLPPVDGLEVIDLFDQVMTAPILEQALGLLAYPANPVRAILSVTRWPRGVLARWDAMAAQRPTIGVLGLDAHGGVAVTEEAGLRFPSHETAARLGRLHFVTAEGLGHDAADRLRVYRAMRAGRFFNAFDGLAPATGFRFEMRERDGRQRHLMGDRVALAPGLRAEVRVPPVGEALVRLWRDGQAVLEAPAAELLQVPVTSPGVWRVEVDLRLNVLPLMGPALVPWVFSNPIYVAP